MGTDRPDDSMIHASAQPYTAAPAVCPPAWLARPRPGAKAVGSRTYAALAASRHPSLRAQTGTRSNSHHGFRVGVVHF